VEIINGSIVLGERPCHCTNHPAGPGKIWNIKYCQNRTKTYGLHNCTLKKCPNNPSGQREWHEVSRTVETCGSCNGTAIVKENYCDNVLLPVDFPIKVQRQGRVNTFNENYLAIGCLYSCTDYGEAAKMTDEEIINKIRTADYHTKNGCIVTQAVNVVRSKDDLRLCDFILVNVTRDGYSVKGGYNN
jgi:hypothetical protein